MKSSTRIQETRAKIMGASLVLAAAFYFASDYYWPLIEARSAVRGELLDPDSANFRDVRYSDVSGSRAVCGEVNSKNRMGGYVGFEFFRVEFSDTASPQVRLGPSYC